MWPFHRRNRAPKAAALIRDPACAAIAAPNRGEHRASLKGSRFVKVRIFVMVVLGIIALDAQGAQSTLMDETLAVINREYVNPLHRDFSAWLEKSRAKYASTCPTEAPCALPVAERLVAAALEGLMDPHLTLFPIEVPDYLAPGEVVGDPTHRWRYGLRVGVGRELVVTYIQAESAAAKVGLRIGDVIRTVEGVNASPSTLLPKLTLLERQRKPAKVTVERPGIAPMTLTLTTELSEYWTPSITPMTKDMVLLTVPDLRNYGTVDRQVHDLLASARRSGASKLILDLRFNRGGSPFGTISIAGAFLGKAGRRYVSKQGTVTTFQYENGKQTRTSSDVPGQVETQILNEAVEWKGEVIVIVSSETFSAGENLASLLQEQQRARVIGQPTAGGLGVTMQSIRLSTGTGLSYSNTISTTLEGQRLPPRVTPNLLIEPEFDSLMAGRDVVLEKAKAMLAEK
jgi:carboxyl-terminal processing protease